MCEAMLNISKGEAQLSDSSATSAVYKLGLICTVAAGFLLRLCEAKVADNTWIRNGLTSVYRPEASYPEICCLRRS